MDQGQDNPRAQVSHVLGNQCQSGACSLERNGSGTNSPALLEKQAGKACDLNKTGAACRGSVCSAEGGAWLCCAAHASLPCLSFYSSSSAAIHSSRAQALLAGLAQENTATFPAAQRSHAGPWRQRWALAHSTARAAPWAALCRGSRAHTGAHTPTFA